MFTVDAEIRNYNAFITQFTLCNKEVKVCDLHQTCPCRKGKKERTYVSTEWNDDYRAVTGC